MFDVRFPEKLCLLCVIIYWRRFSLSRFPLATQPDIHGGSNCVDVRKVEIHKETWKMFVDN